MPQFKPTTLTFVLLSSVLAGCSGTGTTPNTNQNSNPNNPNKNTKPLAELSFKDAGLKQCVDRAARDNNWQTVADVTSLKCFGLDKNRYFFSQTDWVIHDLGGLEQLTALKELDIPGHLYTQIDTSKLTELESLNVYEAFVKNIDLSKNTKLKKLNVGATPIEKLDLTGLSQLQELRVSYNTQGLNTYTDSCINDFGGPLGITAPALKVLKKDIRLDKAVKLTLADVGTNGLLDLPNNSQLQVATGQFTTRSITNSATELKFLDVTLTGDETLDLSQSAVLETAKITSSNLSKINIGANLSNLTVDAPLVDFGTGQNSALAIMVLNNIKMQTQLDLSNLSLLKDLTINSTTLNSLKINKNLNALNFSGPLATLSAPADATLSTLALDNPLSQGVLYTLPLSLNQLSLSNISSKGISLAYLHNLKEFDLVKSDIANIALPGSRLFVYIKAPLGSIPIISPTESVTALTLDEIQASDCSLNHATFANIESLSIYNCSSDTIKLNGMPKLAKINLNMPNLTQISFANSPVLTDLYIGNNKLVDLDLSPFEGTPLNTITLFAYQLKSENVQHIINDVYRLSKQWTLFLNNEAPIIGSRPQ